MSCMGGGGGELRCNGVIHAILNKINSSSPSIQLSSPLILNTASALHIPACHSGPSRIIMLYSCMVLHWLDEPEQTSNAFQNCSFWVFFFFFWKMTKVDLIDSDRNRLGLFGFGCSSFFYLVCLHEIQASEWTLRCGKRRRFAFDMRTLIYLCVN